METGEQFINGASSKSQTSRGNFLRKLSFALWISVAMLSGCEKFTGGDKVELPKEEAFYFSGTTITAQVHNGNKFNSSIQTWFIIQKLTRD